MTPQTLSDLLLDLYALARQSATAEHARRALQRLQRDLPFDRAWWGLVAVSADGRPARLHWSQPLGLPPRFVDDWCRARRDDALARALIAAPGRALHWDAERLSSTPGLAALTAEHGLSQVLSTVRVDRNAGLLFFLSLYRDRGAPAFQATEIQAEQMLMPHLDAMLRTNWLRHVEQQRLQQPGLRARPALALADDAGLLHVSDGDLSGLLRRQWPGWTGPRLPDELCAALAADGHGYRSPLLSMRAQRAGELWCVELAQPGPADRLSPREAEVARCYGAGASHKEVARRLGIAPATVRHQLREVYRKLGVNDKAALASLMLGSDSAAAPA